MKKYLLIPVLMLFVLSLWNFKLKEKPSTDKIISSTTTAEPFVVVELFTSQGCSSCPPADRLLSALYQQSKQEGTRVIPLSFHVAYWNYLGWKDPFSKEAFSQRQRNYAKALHSGVYTPQMVFNGRQEGVGSKANQVLGRVETQLKKPAKASISLNYTLKANELQASFELDALPIDSDVNIALVERDLELYVKRGENGGRTLKHDNVVRDFDTIRLTKGEKKGNVSLSIPQDMDLAKASLVVYAQSKNYGEVYAAAQVDLQKVK